MKYLIFCFLLLAACRKDCPEPAPEIWGDWQVVPTFGLPYVPHYEIFLPGKVCATVPDTDPTFQRCWDVSQRGDSLFFEELHPFVWVWDFDGPDVAIVRDVTNAQTFVLQRK